MVDRLAVVGVVAIAIEHLAGRGRARADRRGALGAGEHGEAPEGGDGRHHLETGGLHQRAQGRMARAEEGVGVAERLAGLARLEGEARAPLPLQILGLEDQPALRPEIAAQGDQQRQRIEDVVEHAAAGDQIPARLGRVGDVGDEKRRPIGDVEAERRAGPLEGRAWHHVGRRDRTRPGAGEREGHQPVHGADVETVGGGEIEMAEKGERAPERVVRRGVAIEAAGGDGAVGEPQGVEPRVGRRVAHVRPSGRSRVGSGAACRGARPVAGARVSPRTP